MDERPDALVEPDVDRTFADLLWLRQPRFVGSVGEQAAGDYVSRRFTEAGLSVVSEPFPVSLGAMARKCRVVFTICALGFLAGAVVFSTSPWLAALTWGTAGYLVNLPWRVRYRRRNTGRSGVISKNFIATSPMPRKDSAARVIFMAHYDTKSQFLPTALRVGLVTGVRVIGLLLLGLGLIAAAGWPQPLEAAGMHGPCVTAVLFLTILLANHTGNHSPGAIDNGSGVALLLELARSWNHRPEAPLEVVWVATSAEETGLQGAWYFLDQHRHLWDEKPTLLINLDSVGAGPRMYLAGEPDALQLAEQTAAALQQPTVRLHVLGAGMDHEPFAACGLPSVSILGDVIRHSFVFHSARDTIGRVDRAALGRAGRLAVRLAWRWADLHLGLPCRERESAQAAPLPDPVFVPGGF